MKRPITCPSCGETFTPVYTRTASHRRNIGTRATLNWAAIRKTYEQAQKSNPGVNPKRDIGPRTFVSMLMRNLWLLTNRERAANGLEPVANYFRFDPWGGAHKPSPIVFAEVFGGDEKARYEGQRLFGVDFGVEVTSEADQ